MRRISEAETRRRTRTLCGNCPALRAPAGAADRGGAAGGDAVPELAGPGVWVPPSEPSFAGPLPLFQKRKWGESGLSHHLELREKISWIDFFSTWRLTIC
jgi:hypothetical protein